LTTVKKPPASNPSVGDRNAAGVTKSLFSNNTAVVKTVRTFTVWFWMKKQKKSTLVCYKLSNKLIFAEKVFLFTMDENQVLKFRFDNDFKQHILAPGVKKVIDGTICVRADISWSTEDNLPQEQHHDDT